MITELMRNQLLALGLSKQQATSSTADIIINHLIPDDGKLLIQEAKNQVAEMQEIIKSLRIEFSSLKMKIDAVAGVLLDIAKAQEEHGVLTDDKARNAVTLYASIINMNERAGAKGADSVNNAGYVTYAFLGGQAKRDVRYDKPQWAQDNDD